jgi:mRNA interferase RelE/StbE
VYKLVYSKEAGKVLTKIPQNTAKLIRDKMTAIAANPYANHPNAKKLQGLDGYRLRVGDWRVVYRIRNQELIVIVLKVGARGDVYK